MPAIKCRCGEKLSYGEIPSPNEWLMISDEDFDGVEGQVDAEKVYGMATSMLRCPVCGRLWVFWEGFNSPPAEYLPSPE